MRLFQIVSAGVLALCLALGTGYALADDGDSVLTPTHRFDKIADGVYFAVGTGSVYVMSNSMVVIGKKEVLVVDSHVTGAAAQALLKAIKTLTDKPVRYLVNTHYHFDHAHGNDAFPDGVAIIGHEYTREKLLGPVLEENTFLSFTTSLPEDIAKLKAQAASETDATKKAALKEEVRIQQDYMEATAKIVPTPPTITLREELSVHLDDREIRLLFLGRGHTGGDIVVYLPEDRIIFTGDLLLPSLSYMGDGFVDEWPGTLEALKQLDFKVVLPGHGAPMTGEQAKTHIGHIQAYLLELWGEAGKGMLMGKRVGDIAQTIDLSAQAAKIPGAPPIGADPRAVARIYELLNERAQLF